MPLDLGKAVIFHTVFVLGVQFGQAAGGTCTGTGWKNQTEKLNIGVQFGGGLKKKYY